LQRQCVFNPRVGDVPDEPQSQPLKPFSGYTASPCRFTPAGVCFWEMPLSSKNFLSITAQHLALVA
jgi:hypothetical protein